MIYTPCFAIFLNTANGVKNTTRSGRFFTNFEVSENFSEHCLECLISFQSKPKLREYKEKQKRQLNREIISHKSLLIKTRFQTRSLFNELLMTRANYVNVKRAKEVRTKIYKLLFSLCSSVWFFPDRTTWISGNDIDFNPRIWWANLMVFLLWIAVNSLDQAACSQSKCTFALRYTIKWHTATPGIITCQCYAVKWSRYTALPHYTAWYYMIFNSYALFLPL